MAREHQPGRIGPNNLKQTNRPIPRGVDKGPAGYTIGLGSTSDTNFEHFNPLPTTGEREDVTRRRFASSAADTQDGRRREKQSIISTPEENAQASRHSNVTHRGSTAGADPYRVPPLSLTGKDRDRISALDQGRDRHKSYANLNITSSIPALSSSATYGPGYTAPINAPSVPAIIDAMKSVSFEDSGEQSNSSPKGWNGPSRPQVPYSTRPPPSIIRPTAAKKSVSLDSGVQYSVNFTNDRNGPSDIQDPYARRGVLPPSSSRPKKSVSLDRGVQPSTGFDYQNGPSDIQDHPSARHGGPLPSSSSRPIGTNKFVSFDSGFQSGSSREGWTGPSRLPYENRYESSHSQETPKEVPQSWQSSNRLNSQHRLLDIASGSPYYPVQPTNTHHEVSEGEYHQTLNRSGNEVQRKELEMRRKKEEEAKRTENEVRMEEGRAQRMEGLTRHAENSTRRFGEEGRRLAQDPALQVVKRQEYEVRRKDEDARPNGETARATDEEFQRKTEERTQWEELHSLEDLTNKVQGRSSYPVTSGGFGDIWKGDLVRHGTVFQVAVKTIRAFEADNKEMARKKANRVRRELKVWERLKHNSILPLWGVADDFGPYLAMVCPWADNGALTGFLELQQYKLSSQDKFLLLNDIALGLQYLHSKSVVHGDLTGSNVLIYGNGRACLADFGLSTIIVEFIGTSYLTSSIRGNVRWVAAELCEATEDSEVSLSAECDIYSFGSITLQILTCKVPYYYVKSDIVVLGQVIKGKKPEPPKDLWIAPGHWSFIQRCWLPRASRPSVGEIVAFVGCERRALSS